ncbi:MAG: cupin domain-containing protein [Myxococcota bacterium]
MRFLLLVSCLVLPTGCASSQVTADCPSGIAEVDIPESSSQIAMRQDDMAWGPCPSVLPAECQMAILEGDPRSESLFTVRFRTSAPFVLTPHSHPRHERVTILEGRVGVGFGDELVRDEISWFGPGDYYVNAKGSHHFVVVDAPALLQITGVGPWRVNYVDAE